MRLVLFSLLALVPLSTANRTACFAYVDCYERAQVQLKDCVGGTAVALTVESKDQSWTAADLVKDYGLLFNRCQDRLTREIVDFDTLQLLVQEDARECFERLPSNGKRISFNPAACNYSPVPLRDSYGKEANQCITEYYEDRQKCEQLLECCPDHLRCGERMNAVSVAYMHARAKGLQIVSNMLKCITSTDPTTSGTVALIQTSGSAVRNPGLPFLRPDVATEERITRRLSLTSTATIEQRRQRFNRRYNQVRALLSQRIHNLAIESSRTITQTPTTQIPSDRRISIIRNLLRNADDQELASYVSLIADGNFEKLSALEREKMNKMENEAQVDQAMEKMGKIRDAIKHALATKEQKTLNFLETSASTSDNLALASHKTRGEENEWNSDVPFSGFISQAMSEIDSDTLVRAKKFANALGEALQAQKELLLATREVEKAKEAQEKELKEEEKKEEPSKEEEDKKEPSLFHVSGIPVQRTSGKASDTDDRDVHDFSQLRKGLVSSDVEVTTQESTETTEATTKAIETTTEEVTTTEAVKKEETTPVPAPIGEVSTGVRPLSQAKMVSMVQLHDGTLETVKTTDSASNGDILKQLEAEIERKGHKEEEKEAKSEEEVGEIKGEDKRAVEESIAEEKKDTEEKEIAQKDGEEKKEKIKEVTTQETTTEEIPTTEENTTEEAKISTEKVTEVNTTSTTEEPTTTTTEEIATTIAAEETTTTNELPSTSVPLTEKSKKLMKRIMKDMKKKIEKLRKKVEKIVAKTTEAPTTTTSPEDRPSVDVEPLTEAVEGSGLEVTTIEAETSTTTEVTTTTTQKVQREQEVNFCASFANCDEMVRSYQEQCDKRFSMEVINHGIEDSEIVAILRNATISHNDIVLRACLRPLDKASYSNLKQLLAIQRGVRQACLELGRNKNILSEEQTAVCTSPLLSTEALDEFLTKTHIRSEETHAICLAKLAPLRDTCHAISGCCASVNACDNYIASSPVRQLREEAQGVLVNRQHACEERMLDTLSYIKKRLTTRRRRV